MINLKEVRKSKGFTQEELAAKCDVQRTTVTMIETGENLPSVQLAKKLAEVVEIDWTEFFNEEVNDRFRRRKAA